jgi:hypothetical protein
VAAGEGAVYPLLEAMDDLGVFEIFRLKTAEGRL